MSQFGSQFHGKPFRKKEGNGKAKKKFRDKRRSESGGFFAKTTLSETDHLKSVRGRGSNKKNKLQYAANVNLLTPSGYKKVKITDILESPDNRNFSRLRIMTKGSIISTEAGKAIITNRPGKEGSVNARLIG
jgi:small subunit ribosomal protein S8e